MTSGSIVSASTKKIGMELSFELNTNGQNKMFLLQPWQFKHCQRARKTTKVECLLLLGSSSSKTS